MHRHGLLEWRLRWRRAIHGHGARRSALLKRNRRMSLHHERRLRHLTHRRRWHTKLAHEIVKGLRHGFFHEVLPLWMLFHARLVGTLCVDHIGHALNEAAQLVAHGTVPFIFGILDRTIHGIKETVTRLHEYLIFLVDGPLVVRQSLLAHDTR